MVESNHPAPSRNEPPQTRRIAIQEPKPDEKSKSDPNFGPAHQRDSNQSENHHRPTRLRVESGAHLQSARRGHDSRHFAQCLSYPGCATCVAVAGLAIAHNVQSSPPATNPVVIVNASPRVCSVVVLLKSNPDLAEWLRLYKGKKACLHVSLKKNAQRHRHNWSR
jgi:hypothetical protein